MNRGLRNTALALLVTALLGIMASRVYALSVGYNTSSTIWKATAYNTTTVDKTLYTNTRPAVGTGGVIVIITLLDNTEIASKLFPYYTGVSDLTAAIPSHEYRKIYVGPNMPGQNVQGDLHYGTY